MNRVYPSTVCNCLNPKHLLWSPPFSLPSICISYTWQVILTQQNLRRQPWPPSSTQKSINSLSSVCFLMRLCEGVCPFPPLRSQVTLSSLCSVWPSHLSLAFWSWGIVYDLGVLWGCREERAEDKQVQLIKEHLFHLSVSTWGLSLQWVRFTKTAALRIWCSCTW